jgi:hypothetical protein
MEKIASIVGGAVLILSLITGIWTFDDRYAHSDDLKETKKFSEEGFNKVQRSLDLGIQKQQQDINKQRIENVKTQMEILESLSDIINEDITRFEKLMESNPDNPQIVENYKNALKLKAKVDAQLIALGMRLIELQN